MRKTTRMMRMIVPTPMYMTFPLVAVNAGAQVLPCQQTLALPTVGLSKPAGAAPARIHGNSQHHNDPNAPTHPWDGRRIVKDRQGSSSPASRPPKEVCTR